MGINTVRGGLGKNCTMIYTMIIYIFTSNFTRNHLALFASFHIVIKELGPLLKRLISGSPGLKFCSTFCIYALLRVTLPVIISFFRSKGTTVFCMFKLQTLLKICLNPGLNFTIFRGTGPWIHN